VTFVLGQAALKAAAKLKMLLAERAAEILGVSSGKVVLKGGRLSAGRGGSPRTIARRSREGRAGEESAN
jgi:CO/xanthine dehydrogenase Mo-binding subunit